MGPIGGADLLLFTVQPAALALALASGSLHLARLGLPGLLGLPAAATAVAIVAPAALVAARVLFGRPASYPGAARGKVDGRIPTWPRRDLKVPPPALCGRS